MCQAATETHNGWALACPACKNCSDKIWGMLFLSMICLLACCANEDPEKAKIRQAEVKARAKIAELPTALKRATGAYEFGKTIRAAIEEVPDRNRRYQLFKEAVDKVFETEIDPYTQNASIRVVDDLLGPIGYGWGLSGRTVEDSCRDVLRTFAWKKTQLERLKVERDKIRPKSFANPIPKSIFNRFENLNGLINSMTYDLEMTITSYESRLWRRKKSQMSPAGWTEVKRSFEEFIGRPMRTPEQIGEYLQKRLEARHLAEEAAKTNRPPPLILIDGTK